MAFMACAAFVICRSEPSSACRTGHPAASDPNGSSAHSGSVADIAATTLASLVVDPVMFVSFAAVLITLILSQR